MPQFVHTQYDFYYLYMCIIEDEGGNLRFQYQYSCYVQPLIPPKYNIMHDCSTLNDFSFDHLVSSLC